MSSRTMFGSLDLSVVMLGGGGDFKKQSQVGSDWIAAGA